MMIESGEVGTRSWGWGTARQQWVCRLSQAIALMIVLGLLLAVGWSPAAVESVLPW